MRPVVIFVAVLQLAVIHGGSAADNDGPYPVWWSPDLLIGSRDKIEAKLSEAILPAPAELKRMPESGGGQRPVLTCNELIAAFADGFYSPFHDLHQKLVRENARCRVIALVRDMKPADISFFRDFKMTEDALDSLSVGIIIPPSCELGCKLYIANERGLACSEFFDEDDYTISAKPWVNELTIKSDIWEYRVNLMARGDSNGDGLENLVFVTRSIALEGTYDVADVFIVGRVSELGVARLLYPGRLLCPDYECDWLDARAKVSD